MDLPYIQDAQDVKWLCAYDPMVSRVDGWKAPSPPSLIGTGSAKQAFVGLPTHRLLRFCFVAGSYLKTVGHFALTRPFGSGTCLGLPFPRPVHE